ncbi:MAG: glucosaminidase domain-containing protein [Clostridiaceae bacterium]|nr:glucosaminidase domain-containing protein [Clostridiaceae bacterium]
MSSIAENKEKIIISQGDISNFRDYINIKYRDLPLEKREAILYNSVTYVVERGLSLHDHPHQSKVVKNLVEKVLFEKKEDLLANTIFQEDVMEIRESPPTEIEESNPTKASVENTTSSQSKSLQWILLLTLSLMLFGGFLLHINPPVENHVFIEEHKIKEEEVSLPAHILYRFQKPNNNFPSYFYYRTIDEASLKQYLNDRQSLLKEEPHFSEILHTAKQFNINPLLLFAIAGHEQAFVPKDHPSSSLIINNPYNVFGSWQVYSTSLKQTSEITARTIYTSLSDLPPHIDPFFWINRRYAEDPNWWKGVRSIFRSLQNIA